MSAQEYSRPGLENIRALITTKWQRGYTQKVIRDIESFFIDSSLDNDSDGWEITIGDPRGDYLAMLERNNEVRIQLLSAGPGDAGHLMTGISDEISFKEDGLITISGRDYASLALDSICPPVRFAHVQPKYVVSKQARALGFKNISLALNGQIKKMVKTDGSETFWEFWYRLYRNEKMWLWVGPNGALVGSRLNYNATPAYYFGTPMQTDPIYIQRQHMRVEGIEINKSTQGRTGTVMVVSTGKHRIPAEMVVDPTMSEWMKRPNKLIEDTVSHSAQKAREKGWNEIFEGKVGSLEIRIAVSEPGHIIRPNRICRLRMPEYDYGGEFFIIGSKLQATESGYIQEIRLREKQIALSRRVPHEPSIPVRNRLTGVTAPGGGAVAGANFIMEGLIPEHPDWGEWFVKAAIDWAKPGGWNEDTFLMALLGTCYLETNFRNIRENTGHDDGEIWQPFSFIAENTQIPPGVLTQNFPGPGVGSPASTPYDPTKSEEAMKRKWMAMFANEPEALQQLGISFEGKFRDAGVGPMQLTSPGLKAWADDYFKAGFHDQYSAGRWHPQWNIYAAARYFANCLTATGISSVDPNITQEEAMWQAGALYQQGPGGDKFAARHDQLRKISLSKFKSVVKDFRSAMNQNSINQGNYASDGTVGSKVIPGNWPNEAQCLAAFEHGLWLGPPTVASGDVSHPPLAGLPSIKFLSAGESFYGKGREGSPPTVRWIVIHTMEVPENEGMAASVASAFAGEAGLVRSAHYNIDDSEIYQSVHDNDTAYGVKGTAIFSGQSVNSHSLHFEHAGYADQTTGDWNDEYSQKMLRISAMLTAKKADLFGIPATFQNEAGLALGNKGFTGHMTLSAAFDPSEAHGDPGANFPWIQYLALVAGFME